MCTQPRWHIDLLNGDVTMMDKTNPMDWVVVLLAVQAVGLKAVVFADYGVHFADVRAKMRLSLLAGGMCMIWLPYAYVWANYGFSPIELGRAATDWWSSGTGFFGMAFAIGGVLALLSPTFAAYSYWKIQRARRQAKTYYSQRRRSSLIPSPRTPS